MNHKIYRSRRGFSLLEMLAVIVIIGLLVGVVVVNVTGAMATARKGTAEAEIAAIVNGLETYNGFAARYPDEEEGLEALTKPFREFKTGILKNKKLNDPWGNPYQYIVNEGSDAPFEVSSFGPDREDGTEDDISSLDIGEDV